MKYDGCFLDGKRFGYGLLYDRNGVIEYEGYWNNNEHYSSTSDGYTIDNHSELMRIPNFSFNRVKPFLLPHYLYSLKQMVIGNDCCGSVRSFILDGWNELESLVIGEYCFTNLKGKNEIKKNQRTDGVFRVVNCPKLQSVELGSYSFSDYHSFEMNALPSLSSFSVSQLCCYFVSSFSLAGLLFIICVHRSSSSPVTFI